MRAPRTRHIYKPGSWGPPLAYPCCDLPEAQHYGRELDGTRHRSPSALKARQARSKLRHCDRQARTFFMGLDGEGHDLPLPRTAKRGERGQHIYTLLAASDADGTHRVHVQNSEGLTTIQCLDFLLALPRWAKVFTFSFDYDRTMFLRDLDNETLGLLVRPDLRPGKHGPTALMWKGYKLNLCGTQFTVSRGGRTRVVWDLFKFYQSKFTVALENWKVGTPEELAEIARMKEKRKHFTAEDREEVRGYCYQECSLLAELAKKLVRAHEEVGLSLRKFYGAGSTAGAILKKIGLSDPKTRPKGPAKMQHAIASAFFGGRFEHSVLGAVKGPLYNYDISSAYPYQLRFLPCLRHGKWRHTTNVHDVVSSRAACVRYSLPSGREYYARGPNSVKGLASWAPFPFREKDGTIVFPSESGGGWVWRDEFLAGGALFPHVECVEAWVYSTKCKCTPFESIPEYYRERCRIGKEGPGIVLKLGPNSVYGKLAQSVGTPPFQSWIWAGMVTSGCRAQILELMALHKDLRNLLSVATDGIYTREKLVLPKPRDTGTWECVNAKGKKVPLGGWEDGDVATKGVFFARPGIYFPMSPTEDELAKVRARGIGRAAMLEHWQALVDGYKAGKKEVKLVTADRFYGAKSCVYLGSGGRFVRKAEYGQWAKRALGCTFDPWPKRVGVTKRAGFGELGLRSFPLDQESAPYDTCSSTRPISPEAAILREDEQAQWEQPDGGDYEVDYAE